MVRTQIQLTEEQAEQLKAVASESGLSMSELVRRGVDALLAQNGVTRPAEKRKQAARLSGKFHSGQSNISEKHDDFLNRAFGE